MRLIDADANIETMKKCAENPENAQALLCYRYAQRILEEAPTVEPASPWHRVEDGLPPKATWVLTIATDGNVKIFNIATVDAGGQWWTYSPQNILRELYGVRYWMPIEPPKEDA